MAKWRRPSGTTVETNDSEAAVNEAERNGWVRVNEEAPPPAPPEPPEVPPQPEARPAPPAPAKRGKK